MTYDNEKIQKYINSLGLPNSFDFQILKTAYRKSVLKYHPDRSQNKDEKIKLESRMKEINESYGMLKDLLEKNNGQLSISLSKKENEKDSNNTHYSESLNYNFKNNSEDDNNDDLDEEFDLDEYLNHINNDSDEEFEIYVKNLYNDTNDDIIKKALIEYRKEQKYNDKIGMIGCLFWVFFIVFAFLGNFIDFFWTIAIILLILGSILGFILFIWNLFTKL